MSTKDFLLLKTILLSVATLVVVVVMVLNLWQVAIIQNTGRPSVSPSAIIQNINAIGFAVCVHLALEILQPYVVKKQSLRDIE